MKLEKIVKGFISFMGEWTANVESSLKGVGSYEAEQILRNRDGPNWNRYDLLAKHGLKSEYDELANGAGFGLALVAAPLFVTRTVYRGMSRVYNFVKTK